MTGGKQYITCNGASFRFFVYHENNLSTPIFTDTYSYYRLRAFEFTAPGTGTYYVKLVGLSSSTDNYRLMIGGPTYALSNLEFPLGTIQMDGSDLIKTIPILVAPEDAIVYSFSVSNVSSSATKGVTVTYDNKKSYPLSTYNMTQNVSVYTNVRVQAVWSVTIKYKKNAIIKPRMTIRYVYPVTSYLAD